MKKEEGEQEQNVSSPEVTWADDEKRMELEAKEQSALEAEDKYEQSTVTYEGADDDTIPLPPQVKHEEHEDDQATRTAAKLFTDYLRACRDERFAMSLLPPGRFLMPGKLAGPPGEGPRLAGGGQRGGGEGTPGPKEERTPTPPC